MSNAQPALILAILAWLGMITCTVGLCYVAAHAADVPDPDDVDPEMSAEVPFSDARMDALLGIQAGLAAAARELDEDLTVCRAIWPDAPAWPDTYTPSGEDGTA